MKKLFSLFVAMMAAFSLSAATVYDWAGGIGTTIFGGNSNITTGTVKIHENIDDVNGIKFGSSYVYADGKYIAIKPTEGGFKAGDVLSVSVVFNNSDVTKYCMVDLRAADSNTRIWMSDSLSTLNGRNAGDPIVQTYTLAADQDSLFLGRYGNTAMFVTLLSVAREAAPTHTYTVAGGSDVLFGTTWAPANEANDMVLIEGLYTWEKSDLELAAGNIEFKVCEDHAWTTAYPAQNYQLNIPEAGIYTITITFNAESKEVNAVATKTGSADVTPTVAMHGNFTGSWVDTENFTLAEGKATASLKLTMEVGNYEFGMRIGGAGNWTANGVQFTRENPSAEVVAGSGNLKLAADKAGEYTFTWTYETNTLAITFPEGGDTPDPELPTVAIAGAFNNWDATVNVMTAAEDKLTASIKITLAAEDNEFKVVVGGSHWYAKDAMYDITRENAVVENVDQEIAMGPNLRLKADVAGEYTFIWTYEGNKLEVIFPEGDIPEPEVPTVAIAGAFNEWSATANVMTAAEDKLTASVTIALTADDVEFKVVVDGSHWLAKDALYDITRENPTVEAVDQEIPMGPNLNLKADVAGDYTFTWTYATKTLTITFPAKEEGIEETIAAGKAAKVLRDGHILILKGEKTFDVTGAIVR